jgi:hypothetical protein
MTSPEAPPEPEPEPPPLPADRRPRPGGRLFVELLLALIAAIAFDAARRAVEFPAPLLRDLRSEAFGRRAGALRQLSLLGRGGMPAVPRLLHTLKADPERRLRGAAALVLGQILAAEEEREAFPLEGLIVSEGSPREAPTGVPPAAPEVAAALVEAMTSDPDDEVRSHALEALGPLLEVATGHAPDAFDPLTFEEFRAISRPPPPPPPVPGPDWARAAARAIAGRVAAGGPTLWGPAAAWVAASPAARHLMTDDERYAALLAGARRGLPVYLTDPTAYALVRLAAARAAGSDARRRAFVAMLDGPDGAVVSEANRDRLFWLAAPGPTLLGEHPERLAAMREWILAPPAPASSETRPEVTRTTAGLRLDAALRRAVDSWGVVDSHGPWLLGHAARREPATLDAFAAAIGPKGWPALAAATMAWDQALPTLLDPARRSGLPPATAAGVAESLLDHEATTRPAAFRFRVLAAAAFFLRATPADHPLRQLYADRVAAIRAGLAVERPTGTAELERALP